MTADTAEVVADLRRWLHEGETAETRTDYSKMFDMVGLFYHLQEMWGMLEWAAKP